MSGYYFLFYALCVIEHSHGPALVEVTHLTFESDTKLGISALTSYHEKSVYTDRSTTVLCDDKYINMPNIPHKIYKTMCHCIFAQAR